MPATSPSRSAACRPYGALLTSGIVALTLATAWIHLGLGGLLFTLNGLGYVGLAAVYVVAVAARHPLATTFGWAPRLALAGYAAMTIVGWAIQGPYFPLAYTAKLIEAGLISLIAVDMYRVFGGPMGLYRSAMASLFGRRPDSTSAA